MKQRLYIEYGAGHRLYLHATIVPMFWLWFGLRFGFGLGLWLGSGLCQSYG